MFADRQDFDTFRKSAEQKFLSCDTFTAYKKAQETHLKSIEDKLNRRFSLFSTNRSIHESNQPRNTSFDFNAIIQFFKTKNLQWLVRILVSLLIVSLAVYLLKSIK